MNIPTLTNQAIKKLLPKRKKDSHKGENGAVLIVGGSYEYFGSPLMSALGALRSGADLVYVAVPECNFIVSRTFMPEFIVHSFPGEAFNLKGLSLVLELVERSNVLLIGPGIGNRRETRAALIELLPHVSIPIVMDAEAILPWESYRPFRSSRLIFTPHGGELERLMGEINLKDITTAVKTFSKRNKANILLKGVRDLVSSQDGKQAYNDTGNAGMTAGGMGDMLAGVVSGFVAQGLDDFAAMYLGAYVVGKAGDNLLKSKGYGFLTHEVADEVAHVLAELLLLKPR